MNKLENAMKKEATKVFTENGCEAYNTTGSSVLDLFATIGAMRAVDSPTIVSRLQRAYAVDPLHTVRCVFYGRDIRGGCGERTTFRTCLEWLARYKPDDIIPNIEYIAEFGRFDDLYTLVGTRCEEQMWAVMRKQFEEDLKNLEEGKSISLLAKWIKSPDATSAKSRYLGVKTAEKMGYSVYDFKRVLRKLRKKLKLVETAMCANDWGSIDYSAVPSKAACNYRSAFRRHDGARYYKYLMAVQQGDAQITASTLHPYDIIRGIRSGEDVEPLELQWEALPNYVGDNDNIVVMADVSGSMTGRPIDTSIGLAMYFAQRNKGVFHNLCMTFESQPSFIHLRDEEDLVESYNRMAAAPWGGSTNLLGAMEALLKLCVDNEVSPADIPKALVVITDMEFDVATGNYRLDYHWDEDIYSRISKMFTEKGYEAPKLIFWNVNARRDTFHADKLNQGVLCVSGQGVSTFKLVLDCLNMSPIEACMHVLDSERYSCITVKEG